MSAAWQLHLWIMAVGILAALPCALLGNFLVLRRMSMMGDAITHAVLPGIAVAFLFGGTRSGPVIFTGAIVAGLLTTLFTQWVQGLGRVDRGAAMGVVFTSLFALGLILIRRGADHVDLDPDCVLYGAIELTPLDTVRWLGLEMPRAALTLAIVGIIDAVIILALYKEFKISSFDPALATTLGIPATLMHYLLMVLVAVTTVAAFEAIGSVLVVAMLIVPPAAAYLLTDRLHIMIVLSLAIAAVGAVTGHLMAITIPPWFGVSDTTTAGMMAVSCGGLFTLCWCAAPRKGLLAQWRHRHQLARRILHEDMLGLLYRAEELGVPIETALTEAPMEASIETRRTALRSLVRSGRVVTDQTSTRLTDMGRHEARGLVRAHRLWETYLHRFLNLPEDHLHSPAHKLEHVTDPDLRARLEARVEHAQTDPQGKRIPGEHEESNQ